MSALTREDLQEELRSFARTEFSQQCTRLAEVVSRELQEQLLPVLQQAQKSPTRPSLRSIHPVLDLGDAGSRSQSRVHTAEQIGVHAETRADTSHSVGALSDVSEQANANFNTILAHRPIRSHTTAAELQHPALRDAVQQARDGRHVGAGGRRRSPPSVRGSPVHGAHGSGPYQQSVERINSAPSSIMGEGAQASKADFRSCAQVVPLHSGENGIGQGGLQSTPKSSSDHFDHSKAEPGITRSQQSSSSVEPAERNVLRDIVDHAFFDYAAGLCIVLNAVLIGVQTEFAAQNVGAPSPAVFAALEWVFCIAFTTELLVRIAAQKLQFLLMAGKWWNIFDATLVTLQLLEKSIEFAAGGGNDASSLRNSGFSAMRMLRILRVIRIIRLVRVLRLIGELRTIVICIGGSMRSLMWTVILLLLIIYITAVYLTQMVSDHRLELGGGEVSADLTPYFGSLFRSVLTLYEATSGGVSWDDAVSPLIEQVSPMLGVLFALYIAFVLLAIMNVVTGVFVETAMQTAKRDKDIYMVHNVRDVFRQADADGDGEMCWEEFQQSLNNAQMKETLQLIDIDISQAEELFKLLDVDESGTVTYDDFIDGCVRLRGPAKSLDLMTVMYEQRRLAKRYAAHLCNIEGKIQKLLLGIMEMTRFHPEGSGYWSTSVTDA